jgi:hypothetical protein
MRAFELMCRHHQLSDLTQQGSLWGLATGWKTEGSQFEPRQGNKFALLHVIQTGFGLTQAPIQWVPEALSPELNRQGREADHSPPTSAEIKKTWVYNSIFYTP